MTNDQTKPWPAGISTNDVPLPQRWYKYRGKILRYRQMGNAGNVLYWEIKNAEAAAKLLAEELERAIKYAN